MALSRKMLKAMGIEDEKIDQIIDAHTETVDALKQERDEYKANAEKLPNVQKQLDTLKEEQEQSNGKNPWKVKYDALKEDYDKYKDGVNAEKTKAAKVEALKSFLKNLGIADKRIDAVVRVSDLDGFDIEDGKIKDEDGKLKKSYAEEWADFIVTKQDKAQEPENPPTNNGGNKMTKQQILEIKDSSERQKAIAENHELFGF